MAKKEHPEKLNGPFDLKLRNKGSENARESNWEENKLNNNNNNSNKQKERNFYYKEGRIKN